MFEMAVAGLAATPLFVFISPCCYFDYCRQGTGQGGRVAGGPGCVFSPAGN